MVAGTVDKFLQVRRYFTQYPVAEGMGADAPGVALESARLHRGYTVDVGFFPTQRTP